MLKYYPTILDDIRLLIKYDFFTDDLCYLTKQ